MQGAIRPGRLPGLFREIYAGRRTGILRFARATLRCSIRFANGHVVHAQSSHDGLHMGEVMVAQGLLTRDALDRATVVVLREGKRLGQILEELGILEREQVEQALAVHVCRILADVFSWRDGEYAFDAHTGESRFDADYPIRASTGDVLLDAARQVGDRAAVQFALGDLDRVLVPASDPLVRFQRVTLTPVDGFVLSRVDGTLSAREVIQVTPLPAEAVERSLFALLCTGQLEVPFDEPKPKERSTAQFLRQDIIDAYESLSSRTHFALLGLTPDATEAQVKGAYLRLARRYHPDAANDPALADLRAKLEAIFFKLSDAYAVLSDLRARISYKARLERPRAPAPAMAAPASAPPAPPPLEPDPVRQTQAEDMFRRGSERYADGKFWEAAALLGEAVALADGSLKPRARVMLARAHLKHPDRIRDAEKELQAAVHEDPEFVEAWLQLAGLYKRNGFAARAAASYRRVLELEPQHREARTEAAALAPAGEAPPESGLLNKLFGKP